MTMKKTPQENVKHTGFQEPNQMSVKLYDVLEEVAKKLRYSRFDEAIKLLQILMRASMQQNLALVLQRYLAELSVECIELSGDNKTAMQYVEQALSNYEGKELQSPEAKKDRIILMLKKAYLLIKLDEKEQLHEHLAILNQHLIDKKTRKIQAMLQRMQYLNSAAEQSILAEQRQLGLFQLSEQLKKQGAGLVCGVR
ncbi:hypothetical protein [Glaciecola sp. MF2-115]|uniref:hypothetical protein n=1 Tax=Glaciecola sp. MF2-115 TaxID=3384827 RepID=UPI00399F0912